jgi:PAS domain S-box-containing protein
MGRLDAVRGLRLNGDEFPMEASISQIQVNGRKIYTAILRDITERKRAEEALRESESKFRTLFETMNEGFSINEILCNEAGEPYDLRYLEVNPAFEIQTGLKAADVLGRTTLELFPGAEPIWFERYGKVALTGEPAHFEAQFGPLGRWFEVNAYQTEPGRFAAVFFDTTERKRAQEELSRLNADLEKRVAERTSQLASVIKELEAFSYSVSHDLRAPLRSIDGFSQALLEDYGDQIPDEGRNYLDRVRAAAQRMALLIDDLLALSRVTRTPVARKPVDLSILAERILAELRLEQPDRIVSLSVTPNLVVNGDENLLQIALHNLLANAWKFTSKRQSARIEFGMQEGDDGRVYYVRDNGSGFDMNYVDKLFGAFQRLHSTDDFPGTGIGLATVQRILHKHGGKVWAVGEVDQGATFYFVL